MFPRSKKSHDGEIAGPVPDAYRHLVVERKNDAAYMRTESFVTELKPHGEGKAYRYLFDPATVADPAQSCFVEVNVADVGSEEVHRCAAGAGKEGPPPQRYKELRARWVDRSEWLEERASAAVAETQGRDNLFGGYGAFLVSGGADRRTGKATGDAASLRIPRIDRPTGADFAFYGCKLLRHGDLIGFDEPLPLFTSDRTENYAFDYLLASSGIYVETHDIVHLHQPMVESGGPLLDGGGRTASGGYWVLGKNVAPEMYRFSALRIPFGAAAAMPPGVIHNDVYLTGQYRAVYGSCCTRTVQISSVIVRDAADGAKIHMI